MKSAPEHPQEQQRLSTLFSYQVMDSAAEQALDELTELASAICGTPIALISLVDNHRQWFKSRVGLTATETPKSIAFCAHTILQDHVFEIPNALEDSRFADNPLVAGSPDIRFYAGAPLIAPDGSPIGTLCVIDQKAKKLSDDQLRALQILSRQVISQLELRRHHQELQKNYKQQQQMLSSIAHDLRSPFNGILGLASQLAERAENMSHERIIEISHHILDASLRVYQLLDEMLQWTCQRVGAANQELKSEALLPLVESSFDLLNESLRLKNIHYSCDINSHSNVLADATLTKAIIRNLLNNAIKFTPDGGDIKIYSSTKGNMIELRVRNSGEPLSEEIQQRLFSSPVNSAEGTAGEQGTGLGLSLCYDFVRQQGGTIWIDNSISDGACFAFSLSKAS